MNTEANGRSGEMIGEGVELWTGRAVFVSSPTPAGDAALTQHTPRKAPHGSADSPISITSSPSSSPWSSSSSSSSPDPLPRPRAVPHYASPISRTAYTPPRSPFRQASSPGPAISATGRIHPFFARSRSNPLPPPPPQSQKPRMVAEYSSTSDSQSASQETGASSSTWSSQPQASQERQLSPLPIRPAHAQSTAKPHSSSNTASGVRAAKARNALSELEIDEILQQVGSIDLTGKFRENPRELKRAEGDEGSLSKLAQDKGKGKGKEVPGAGLRPEGSVQKHAKPAAAAASDRPRPLGFPAVKRTATTSSAASGTGRDRAIPPAEQKTAVPGGRSEPQHGPPSASRPPAAPRAPGPFGPPLIGRPLQAAHQRQTQPEMFDYRKYSPAPRIAYTTCLSEAHDLLSCLRGPVLGLDLEWPMAGTYRVRDPKTGIEKQIRVGMTWSDTQKKWIFGQGRTALIQVCDERLIVIVHLQNQNLVALPEKFVEIMQDPNIYKTGVAVRGDGAKLHRDFPNLFPQGLSNLLELTYLARQIDPIATGPGSTLISLANLCRQYTGKELDKEVSVRKSAWMLDLTPAQLNYAANDVYAGLQIYLTLIRLAKERGVDPDLTRASHRIDPQGLSSRGHNDKPSPGGAAGTLGTGPLMTATTGGERGPAPAQARALARFQAGLSPAEIAEQGGIKAATVEGYICAALMALPDDTLSLEEKKRFVNGVNDQYMRKLYRPIIKKMRRDVGEVVDSSSEVEAEDGAGAGGGGGARQLVHLSETEAEEELERQVI